MERAHGLAQHLRVENGQRRQLPAERYANLRGRPPRNSQLRGQGRAEEVLHRGDLRRSKPDVAGDRKSTRLNSSHLGISYAVFCLKNKRYCQISAPVSCYSVHTSTLLDTSMWV